jgi:hypothetical protein
MLTALVVAKKNIAALEHLVLRLLRRLPDTAEIAMAVHEPEQSVVRHKRHSEVLDRLPRLCELLRHGELDLRRVRAVDDRVVTLADPAMITAVDDALIEVASGLTHTQLARRASLAVAQVDPAGCEQRRRKAQKDRKVEFVPLPDGMAQLRITMTAIDARVCHDVLTQDARALVRDDRTTDQKRADAFLDRFLGYGVDRKVKVHVTVSKDTLMGLADDPGLLDGYGPIAAHAARELAAQGTWRGLFLGPARTAEALTVDTYRPTALIKDMVVRNAGGHCQAPGCTTPIQELDHTIPWPKGTTSATQLAGYCAHHHHLKHRDYTVSLDQDGTLHWTTPQGRHYTTQPHQY